jgi:broad specificity phosphatase PhoE
VIPRRATVPGRAAFLVLVPVLALAAAPLAGPLRAQETTTVILVRHAERAGPSADDPGLTPAGEGRAHALAEALAAARLTGIGTTPWRRTRLTAAPLARESGLTPLVVATDGGTAAHVREVADTIRARFHGGTVLVVGHSNTVPGIIAALGGPRLPDLCESEYATLFVLTLREGSAPSLVRARYGAEDGPAGSACRPMGSATPPPLP